LYHQALHRLGALLKQNNRRAEAVEIWQQIAATTFDDVTAHVELSKHYEWQHRDVATAIEWTQRALALVDSWGRAARARVARQELEHRLTRLQAKVASHRTNG
jgi:transcription elongation factor GreA-like protein